MATGMVLSVAQTILAALQSKKELRELCSMFGYESQLDELKATISTIQAVLLDAESKHQELTNQGRDWIEKLKDAVYDVDDLVDELNTIAHLWKRNHGAKFTKKVRRFFSRYNKWFVGFNASSDIKKMREKLDSIASDRTKFGFGDLYEPVKRKEETGSYVYEQSIIGRDADKEAMVDFLLGDFSGSSVSYITIVGIGGLGKTALAQIVYSDDRILRAFDSMLWVCVSEEFSMKEILNKMLMSATQDSCNDLTMDQLYRKVGEFIARKKYLLVLDDVWEDRRQEWLDLMNFLVQGEKGSRIVVTTRSKGVANALGDYPVFELQGLSEEDSWRLFKLMAFKEAEEQIDTELIDIGKRLVERCASVPLAIRVVGSMLYGQGKSKWLSFDSAEILGKDGVTSILKFSYYHLPPCLKSCFSYCALFPKDFVIKKQLLISLWLAQGCLDANVEGWSREDVGEDYFMILLQRCFFQDIKKDNDDGEIYSFKVHDLIHDLAQQVAGKEYECLGQESKTNDLRMKIRHLSNHSTSFTLHRLRGCTSEMHTMRTYLHLDLYGVANQDLATFMFANGRFLRFIDLRRSISSLQALPKSLGKLIHLRYLDLSHNHRLQLLPKSITKLHNLIELRLHGCLELKELPDELRVLVNLRLLDIRNTDKLTHMPPGMHKLTNLHTLTMFVVGCKTPEQAEIGGQLQDLQGLVNLKGKLVIKLKKGCSYNLGGLYILRQLELKSLKIKWENDFGVECQQETMLEGLEPHCDLRALEIGKYRFIKLPTWAMQIETSLPHLTRITLSDFNRCEHLPSFSQLPHLKFLDLTRMYNLKFIDCKSGDVPFSHATFFPSLLELRLVYIRKLKRWWEHDRQPILPSFPRLHYLSISDCLAMTSFPSCPQLKTLRANKLNEAMRLFADGVVTSSANLCLEDIEIDNPGLLSSLSEGYLRGLCRLGILDFGGESLSTAATAFERCSSLVHLRFQDCLTLKTFSGSWIEHLSNLQSLKIENCPSLNLEENVMTTTMQVWNNSLSSLHLHRLAKLVNLPEGIRYLTALQTLHISDCVNLESIQEGLSGLTSLQSLFIKSCDRLKSLPGAMRDLTSLKTLEIIKCKELKERVRKPDGEDWCNIEHIPRLDLRC